MTHSVLRSVFLSIVALSLMALAPALERLAVAESKLVDPVWDVFEADSNIEVDHSAWTAFLQTYVTTDAEGINRVAYADVTNTDQTALDDYLTDLQSVDPRRLNRNEQLAYWTNLYNARTVDLILEYYPVKSIREIKFGLFSTGPWGEPLMTVIGKDLSLNHIESGIVRPIWDEPRIHYTFNCAALGCPNLGKEAYRGATIERQMEEAANAYVNHSRGVAFDEDGELILSKIYAWYREDYGEGKEGVLSHIKKYLPADTAALVRERGKVDSYAYDWDLNDAATAE